MNPLPGKASAWIRSFLGENAAVQGEATMLSLRGFRWVAAVVLMVNLGYAAAFLPGQRVGETAVRVLWGERIFWAHCSMGLAMVVLGLAATWICRRSERASIAAIVLQVVICAASLAFAVVVTVADQPVTGNTSPFALICLIVVVLSRMRPLMALPLLLAAYIALFNLLPFTQSNPALLEQARGSARDTFLMAVVVSWTVWRQYVTGVLMRREVTRSHKALVDHQAELVFLASRDYLTGLYNRREFMRQAEHELARARRYPSPTCLIIVDIDHFKLVNDKFGHPAGDAVLTQTAARLKDGVRGTDLVARMGGEEFILLMTNCTLQHALGAAEKLRALLGETPVEVQGQLIPVTASFGVAALEIGDTGTLESLYGTADRAMYQAKARGRNRVEFVMDIPV